MREWCVSGAASGASQPLKLRVGASCILAAGQKSNKKSKNIARGVVLAQTVTYLGARESWVPLEREIQKYGSGNFPVRLQLLHALLAQASSW